MSDENVHAAHPESVRPNCELGPTWQRDPLDFVRLTDSPTDVDGDPLPSP